MFFFLSFIDSNLDVILIRDDARSILHRLKKKNSLRKENENIDFFTFRIDVVEFVSLLLLLLDESV